MKKTIILIVTILLALLLCTEAMAASIQKSIIPADAKWVFHFDMKKFSTTKMHELIMDNKDTIQIRKKTARIFRLYKFDPIKDIAAITIFGPEKKKEDTVACIEGNFDKEYLLGLLEEETDYQKIQYDKYTIYNWDSDDFGVFVTDNLLLFSGNEAALKETLDVISGKRENISSSPMITYLEAIPAEAFITAVADDISSLAEDKGKAVILKKMGMASFAIMEKADQVALNINVTTGSPQDAQKVEQVVRGLIAFGELQLDESMIGMKLMEDIDIKISVDGNKVRMSLTSPIEKFIAFISGHKKFPPCFLLGNL
jgi:hypothetical protein